MTADADVDVAEWREELVSNRAEKDEFFRTHPHSPIPKAERDGFEGLSYFDPDPTYRVDATVHLVDAGDDEDEGPGEDVVYRMETSTGGEQRYLKVAELAFEIEGETHILGAYRQAGEERESLFVPFRDKTTGQETYGAGRYMELEAEGELEDGQSIPVDFNLAYNPFCAYSEAYACPLPPEENWLATTIEAGEKDWD